MISKSTEYAIRALVFIRLRNRENHRPGVGEIAKEIDTPMAYTGKILQILTRHKLLNSMKGRGGGFFFDEDKSSISMYDVIHIMEGDSTFSKCGFGLKNCDDNNPCPLHDQYLEIREGFYNLVKSETIESLADKIIDGTAVINRIARFS